jgi:hypothetical protein
VHQVQAKARQHMKQAQAQISSKFRAICASCSQEQHYEEEKKIRLSLYLNKSAMQNNKESQTS